MQGRRKEKLGFGQRSTDRTGRSGVTGTLRVAGKYPKVYRVSTHGLTPAQAAEKIRAIEARHAEKEVKLEEMQQLVGREFSVNLERFRITDAVLWDRGESDCEVVVQIARLEGVNWTHVPGMPIRRIVGAVGNVPPLQQIEELARERAEQIVLEEIEQQEFEAELSTLLGG